MTRRVRGIDATGQSDRAPAPSRPSDLVEAAIELVRQWVADGVVVAPRPQNHGAADPRRRPGVELPAALDAEVSDLHTYLRAHTVVEARPRRGSRKGSSGALRAVNAGPSVRDLTRAWAKERDQSERWARRRLDLLVSYDAVRREPCGSGYAWRLRRP